MIYESEFNPEKICTEVIVSSEFLSDAKIDISTDIRDMFIVRLNAFVLERTNEKQKIRVYHKRPTFLQWLLRKEISIEVEIDCKEVIKNPPKLYESKFFYSVKQVE